MEMQEVDSLVGNRQLNQLHQINAEGNLRGRACAFFSRAFVLGLMGGGIGYLASDKQVNLSVKSIFLITSVFGLAGSALYRDLHKNPRGVDLFERCFRALALSIPNLLIGALIILPMPKSAGEEIERLHSLVEKIDRNLAGFALGAATTTTFAMIPDALNEI